MSRHGKWIAGISRGKNGKACCSFGFAQAFALGGDCAQRCGVGEPVRTAANVCASSTSWGSLVRAQYRPSKKPCTRAFCWTRRRRVAGLWQGSALPVSSLE
jgi:hypothetical protein